MAPKWNWPVVVVCWSSSAPFSGNHTWDFCIIRLHLEFSSSALVIRPLCLYLASYLPTLFFLLLGWWRTMLLVYLGYLPIGPDLLLAKKNCSLSCGTEGRGPDHQKSYLLNMLVFQIDEKWACWEERLSVAYRAHVRHRRVAHIAYLSLYL